jgi:hypothetical protein
MLVCLILKPLRDPLHRADGDITGRTVRVGANGNPIAIGRQQEGYTRFRPDFYRTLAGPELPQRGRWRCEAYVLSGFCMMSTDVVVVTNSPWARWKNLVGLTRKSCDLSMVLQTAFKVCITYSVFSQY